MLSCALRMDHFAKHFAESPLGCCKLCIYTVYRQPGLVKLSVFNLCLILCLDDIGFDSL